MRIWIDAHISPGIAAWLNETFDYEAHSLRGLGLRDADDLTIFMKAKEAGVIFVTKDSDFVDLIETRGSPPKVILLKRGIQRTADFERSSPPTSTKPSQDLKMEKQS